MGNRTVFNISYAKANKVMSRALEEVVHFDVSAPNEFGEITFEYNGGTYAVYLTIDAYGKRTLDIWEYRVNGDKHREITVDPWMDTASYVRWLY